MASRESGAWGPEHGRFSARTSQRSVAAAAVRLANDSRIALSRTQRIPSDAPIQGGEVDANARLVLVQRVDVDAGVLVGLHQLLPRRQAEHAPAHRGVYTEPF